MSSSAVTTDHTPHRVAWVAAGLRRAARTFGVELPASYTEAVAAQGLACCEQLAVTGHGAGIVIHTAPESDGPLPVILGYADPAGQYYRDGRRHSLHESARADTLARAGIGL